MVLSEGQSSSDRTSDFGDSVHSTNAEGVGIVKYSHIILLKSTYFVPGTNLNKPSHSLSAGGERETTSPATFPTVVGYVGYYI